MTPEDRVIISGIGVSLYRQKSGGNLFAYFTVNKKVHRTATKEASIRAAREVARKLVAKALSRTGTAAGTIKTAVDDMMKSRWPDGTEDDRTFVGVRARLGKFVKTAGNTPLKIDREEMTLIVQRYLDGRKVSARTRINDKLVLSRFFTWLMQEKIVQHWSANPASSSFLKLDRPEEGPKLIATQEHVDALLGRAKGCFRAVCVLILSGLRPAGACRTLWSAIDTDARTLDTMEKGRPRQIRLSPWACEELKAIEHLDKTVWHRKTRQFFHVFQSHTRALGLHKTLTTYSLRRAVVARLWAEGYEPEQAAKALGHSVAVAQKHYRALEAVAVDVSVSLDWSAGRVQNCNGAKKPDDVK